MSHYDEFRDAENHESAYESCLRLQREACPNTFCAMELSDDPILKFFGYGHLTNQKLRDTSQSFHDVALFIVRTVPRNAERSVALRKILEARDAAVRAAL